MQKKRPLSKGTWTSSISWSIWSSASSLINPIRRERVRRHPKTSDSAVQAMQSVVTAVSSEIILQPRRTSLPTRQSHSIPRTTQTLCRRSISRKTRSVSSAPTSSWGSPDGPMMSSDWRKARRTSSSYPSSTVTNHSDKRVTAEPESTSIEQSLPWTAPSTIWASRGKADFTRGHELEPSGGASSSSSSQSSQAKSFSMVIRSRRVCNPSWTWSSSSSNLV